MSACVACLAARIQTRYQIDSAQINNIMLKMQSINADFALSSRTDEKWKLPPRAQSACNPSAIWSFLRAFIISARYYYEIIHAHSQKTQSQRECKKNSTTSGVLLSLLVASACLRNKWKIRDKWKFKRDFLCNTVCLSAAKLLEMHPSPCI